MKPLVFVHGFLGTIQDWTPVISELSKWTSCFCIPLPGHGQEPPLDYDQSAAYIHDKINALGLSEPPVCVGYSLGGRLLLHTAKAYPGCMQGLVLMSSHFGLSGADEKKVRFSKDLDWAGMLRQEPFYYFLQKWYQQDLFKTFLAHPFYSESLREKLKSHRPDFLASMLLSTSVGKQEDLRDVFLSFGKKALYIAGEEDTKYFLLAKQLRKLSVDVSVCLIPKSGHVVHLEATDRLVEILNDYLRRF